MCVRGWLALISSKLKSQIGQMLDSEDRSQKRGQAGRHSLCKGGNGIEPYIVLWLWLLRSPEWRTYLQYRPIWLANDRLRWGLALWHDRQRGAECGTAAATLSSLNVGWTGWCLGRGLERERGGIWLAGTRMGSGSRAGITSLIIYSPALNFWHLRASAIYSLS